jgi:AraC-like DNA-binding protein
VRATPARDDYWIQLPLRGGIETTTGRASVACDTRRGAVCTPRQENLLRSDAGSARFNISLTRNAVMRQLTALLGDLPRHALEFEPVVDLTAGYGRSLARHLHFAVNELECEDSMLWEPSAMARFEELLITGLLLSHPHSYSDALNRLARPVAPRDVKRAVDYMQARLGDDVTLADIVEQSRVPGRTLFKHFRDVHGVSPMRYLRNIRFDQVHAALGRAQPGETVGDVAARHGFTHMGRFSVEYRKRFGETPSMTLGRGGGG